MQRYFFNIFDGRNEIDTVGIELRDKHAAWEQATRSAGSILRDLDGDLKRHSTWRMEVTDEARKPIFVISIHAEDLK
jgi:hypothetical protein